MGKLIDGLREQAELQYRMMKGWEAEGNYGMASLCERNWLHFCKLIEERNAERKTGEV